MKRFLLSLSIILAFALTAEAQPFHHFHPYRPAPLDDHFGDIRLHVGGEVGLYDIGGLFMHNMPYHYSVGGMAEFQTGQFLSLGVGAGYYGTRHINNNHFANESYLNCVPLYGNIRLSTNGWIRLFAEARAGYAFATNQVYVSNQGGNLAAQGFYTGAAVGLDFNNNNFSVGFNSVDISHADTYQPVYQNGSNRKLIATDFYLRYSYAIPLN